MRINPKKRTIMIKWYHPPRELHLVTYYSEFLLCRAKILVIPSEP